jgi:hypothetical protein
MPRWLLVSLLGGAIVTACVLPDVEIDPELEGDVDDVVGMNQPGAGGAGISVPPLGGSSGAAGQSGDIDPDTIVPPAAGGSAATDVNAGGALGGSGGAAGSGGATAGSGGTGAGGSGGNTGAGGTGAPPPSVSNVEENCSQDLLDREQACINYCQQYMSICSDVDEANTYSSELDCNNKCLLSTWPIGVTTDKNSICCRWLHATLAAQGLTTKDPHCFHSAEFPSKGETGAGCALPAP